MPGAVMCHHVGLADLVPPAIPAHQGYKEHGQDEAPCVPLGLLDIQTDTTVAVSSGYSPLKPGLLASLGLLLHQHGLQILVLDGVAPEKCQRSRTP